MFESGSFWDLSMQISFKIGWRYKQCNFIRCRLCILFINHLYLLDSHSARVHAPGTVLHQRVFPLDLVVVTIYWVIYPLIFIEFKCNISGEWTLGVIMGNLWFVSNHDQERCFVSQAFASFDEHQKLIEFIASTGTLTGLPPTIPPTTVDIDDH